MLENTILNLFNIINVSSYGKYGLTNFKIDQSDIRLSFDRSMNANECINYLDKINEGLCSFCLDNRRENSYHVDSLPFSFDRKNLKYDSNTGCYYYSVPRDQKVINNFASLVVNIHLKSAVRIFIREHGDVSNDVVNKSFSSTKLTNKEKGEYAYAMPLSNNAKEVTRLYLSEMEEVCDSSGISLSTEELYKIDFHNNVIYFSHFPLELARADLKYGLWSLFSQLSSDSKENERVKMLKDMLIDYIYEKTGIVIDGYNRIEIKEAPGLFKVVPFIKNKEIERNLTQDEINKINNKAFMYGVISKSGSININDDDICDAMLTMIKNTSIHQQYGLNIELDQQKHKQLKVSNNANTSRSESGYGSIDNISERSPKVNTLPNIREESHGRSAEEHYDSYSSYMKKHDISEPSSSLQELKEENVQQIKKSWCVIL